MGQADLRVGRGTAPLAERMRPPTIWMSTPGQQHLLGCGQAAAARRSNNDDPARRMIFWGPPGVGKTTLAKIIAQT